jgi:flagellar hook-associated protein 3 FlgL
MRVTESRMIDLATQAVSDARGNAADAQQVMSSGNQVTLPSDDVTKWAEGMRAQTRLDLSKARGTAIGRAKDSLSSADGTLESLTNIVTQVRQLAVQMANGTFGATERTDAAKQVLALRDEAIAAANARGADGEYLLAGTLGAAQPFANGTGVYNGNATPRQIEAGPSSDQTVTLPGSVLTASSGVDIFTVMQNIATAMSNNDPASISGQLNNMDSVTTQVAQARDSVGTRLAALNQAENDRQSFEQQLNATHSAAVEADPIAAASSLAQANQALQTAQAVAQQVISFIQRQ